MRAPLRSTRAGWTLIEVLLAATFSAGVVAQAALAVNSALGLASDESTSLPHEDQARRVMDWIVLAVMGSDRDTLVPGVQALHTSRIRYSFSLGLEGGELVWSVPEEIRLQSGDGASAVEWRENPGVAEERRVVWSSLVRPLLEGEVINGADDNGNGLIDEDGLSFVLDGKRLVIRLTLRRPQADGRALEETVERVVYCRN